MKHERNLTSKGQVTIPKDIRDALGLVTGMPVAFELSEDGSARILKADTDAQAAQRKAEFLERLKKAQAIFKANDTMPGISVDDYMDLIREPLHPFELKMQR